MEMSELRAQAIRRLKKKRDFQAHALAYILVNASLVVVWFTTGPSWLFWPIFPILGWGIGLAFHAWDVYGYRYSEEEIEREVRRLKDQSGGKSA